MDNLFAVLKTYFLIMLAVIVAILLTSCGVNHKASGSVAINPAPAHVYVGIDPETLEFIERVCTESKRTTEEQDNCIEKLISSMAQNKPK